MYLHYKPLTLADQEAISAITLKSDNQDCDYSFSNLYSWHFLYDPLFCIIDDILVLKYNMEGQPHYMMPMGEGNLLPILQAMIDECHAEGHPFVMDSISEKNAALLEKLMPGRFDISTDRDYCDYIYLRSDLSQLKGKRYQPKRNHINQFMNAYPHWSYTPITPDRINECLEMERRWCIANDCEDHEGLGEERQAIVHALMHIDELGLTGGILFVEGKIVGFTFGMPINGDTFGVQVEKADSSIKGAYAVINQQFASHLPERYTYVNREEDLGIEGLRKAKLSYQPTQLLPKYSATLKE